MRVLMTGATGCLGRTWVRERGCRITPLHAGVSRLLERLRALAPDSAGGRAA